MDALNGPSSLVCLASRLRGRYHLSYSVNHPRGGGKEGKTKPSFALSIVRKGKDAIDDIKAPFFRLYHPVRFAESFASRKGFWGFYVPVFLIGNYYFSAILCIRDTLYVKLSTLHSYLLPSIRDNGLPCFLLTFENENHDWFWGFAGYLLFFFSFIDWGVGFQESK